MIETFRFWYNSILWFLESLFASKESFEAINTFVSRIYLLFSCYCLHYFPLHWIHNQIRHLHHIQMRNFHLIKKKHFISIVQLSITSTLALSLREKCPYSEFLWSTFSRIRTEYGEIRRISDTEYLSVFSTNLGKYRSE